MLKTVFEFETETLHFICPFCGTEDLAYISMPTACWNCGKLYLFDVTNLATNQYYRYQYYKHEKVYNGVV